MAKKKAHAPTLADRVAHLEKIQDRFLTAHGETYAGARDDHAQLREHRGDDAEPQPAVTSGHELTDSSAAS